MITIEDVLREENLDLALEHLSSRKEGSGEDGILVSEFASFWQVNKETFIKQFRDGSYQPGAVKQVEIINYKGKRRKISLLNCTDRFFLRAVQQIFQPVCEELIPDCSHAYREEHGTETAVNMATHYMEQGRTWVAEIDIEKFFDMISIQKMESILRELEIMDETLIQILRRYFRVRVLYEDGKVQKKSRGLVQGSPLSPLLSNLYLLSLDKKMLEEGYSFIRFSDDMRIYAQTFKEAELGKKRVEEILAALDLNVHQSKSGIYDSIHRRFLGYYFVEDEKGKIFAKKFKGIQLSYKTWHRSSLQRTDRQYHLINDGILTKKDFTILFENENGKNYLPVETVDSLNIYSNIILNSNFLEFISKKKMRVVVFDKYGTNLCTFSSMKYMGSGKTMLKQAAIYLDEKKRLEMAKKIEMGAMHNIRANLRYYQKKKKSEIIGQTIEDISLIIKEMNEAKELNQLMLMEARARQMYYRAMNEILLNKDFYFEQRTKRPPKDALNALISFGNVFVYNRIATEIYKTSLDIRIGFLHSTNARAESLNLDIAELFKPILVDRAIFTLVNRQVLDRKKHFESVANGGVYLNKEGKKIFLDELKNKLYQKIQVGNQQRTYEYIMREEIQKILRMVLYDAKYKPYKYTT